MFEIFGPLTRPTPSILPLLLASLPLLGVLACLGEPQRARARVMVVCVSGAIATLIVLGLGLHWPPEQRSLLAHLGTGARVGQLELGLALALDPLAAFASAAAFVLTAKLVFAQGADGVGTRRRIALLCVASFGVQVAVMADGAATLVLGLGSSSLASAVLGWVRARNFIADRIAEVALVAATAVAFWSLGGVWIDRQYVPELEARVVVAAAQAPPAPAKLPVFDDDAEEKQLRAPVQRNGQAYLSLTSLPGAMVLVDGSWLKAVAPFADVPISPGPHTIRVHVGAGSDDYYIPRVTANEGDRVALALRGPTTTFREVEGNLASHDASGTHDTRAAVARRRFFGGLSAASLVTFLVMLAFIARVRLFPFAASVEEPARALMAVATLTAAARYPFGPLSPRTCAAFATWLLAGSVIAHVTGLAESVRLVKSTARTTLAAELALAGAGIVAGVPAIAMVHGTLAALSFSRATNVALFASRAAILGALVVLPYGWLPVVLALGATFVGSIAVARSRSPSPAGAGTMLAAASGLVLAIDPRVVGIAHEPLANLLLAPSFGERTAAAVCSMPLWGLVAALIAFGHLGSRSNAASTLAQSSLARAVSRVAPIVSRAIDAITRAAVTALSELEARASDLLTLVFRMVRGSGELLAALDQSASTLVTRRLPVPSERAARLAIVSVALAALVLFAVPWLS